MPGQARAQVEALITRPGSLADGERLYHKWCARCHGAGAVSSSGLPDLPTSLAKLQEEAFSQIAIHGLSGTGMPAMGGYLKEGDLAGIVRYLESKLAKP